MNYQSNIEVTGYVGNVSTIKMSLSSFKFSGGEIQVKVLGEELRKVHRVHIKAHLRSSDDTFELLLITDAIRRITPNMPIGVTIPYVPYARQDRPCAWGEALSIKVFADLINAQNYDHVTIWDAHSDVTPALINRCSNVKQSAFIATMLTVANILVSPDAGANKKVYEIAKAFPGIFTQVIRADKTRDVQTGAITGTAVYCDDLQGEDVLIVDDIADGMRTFLELGKVLKQEKNAGKVVLYVTHGIFSKGVDIAEGVIDTIYSANIWRENVAGRNTKGILRDLDSGKVV